MIGDIEGKYSRIYIMGGGGVMGGPQIPNP